MHAEQSTCTLDGEESTTESLFNIYPQLRPVAVEELSFEDRVILESVSDTGFLSRWAKYADLCIHQPNEQIVHGQPRTLQRRGRTRRFAAIFDEKGIPLPSATGVVIGAARSSMLPDEQDSETEPIVINHTAAEKASGFRAFGRMISSAARSALTCHRD